MPTYVTNGGAWGGWNTVYTSTTTTASTYTIPFDPVWQAWNSTGTTITTTFVGNTWGIWNNNYVETAEQKASREVRDREWREQQARENAERAVANERAAELLRMVLTEAQIATLDEHGWFEVISNKGRRFRIRTRSGVSGNVDLMPEIGNEREASYCAHPQGLPSNDVFVAQKLAIEDDEDEFTKIANVHYINRGARRQAVAA